MLFMIRFCPSVTYAYKVMPIDMTLLLVLDHKWEICLMPDPFGNCTITFTALAIGCPHLD